MTTYLEVAVYEFTRRGVSTLWRTIRVRRWIADLELRSHRCSLHPEVELEPLVRPALSEKLAEDARFFTSRGLEPRIQQGEHFKQLVTCPHGHVEEAFGKLWEHEETLPALQPVPA
jgi:hypothetical protein